MVERRTKIVLASAVMVSAVGGSLLFFRPTQRPQPAAASAPDVGASMTLRHRIEPPAATTAEVSHLLGRIEPEVRPAAEPEPRVVTRAKPATSRQTYEVGELPAPAWSPVRPQASDRPLVHRVREGETLSSLARHYLGSADRYAELFAANRQVLSDPDQLRPGMELVIPQMPGIARPASVQTSRPAGTAPADTVDSGSMVPITPGAWRRGRQSESPVRHYRVQAEDTLVDIAKQFYGDGSKFQQLYEANRDQLAGPDQLREGLLLVIP
ncbi:MAG TPA: LysM peptidoglycan-binding domain-containing protein [Pirellulales bacterium]